MTSDDSDTENSVSGSDSDEPGTIDVDEYEFDFDDFVTNPKKKVCILCHKNKRGLNVCNDCMYKLFITKTNAKKEYNLTDNDLSGLEYHERKNIYHGYTYLYFLKDIRMRAIEKRFGVSNPPIGAYRNCLEILLDESKQRKNKSKERSKKIMATRQENYEKKKLEKELAYAKRKNKLKKALIKADPKIGDIDTDIKCCREYLDGERDDLKQVVKQMRGYITRKNKLSKALKKKGLKIRDDSYYCKRYLKYKEFPLDEVVNMMEIMHFFATKTDYFALTKKYLQNQYDDAKNYGYWDGQKIILCENEKEKIKLEALKNYIKKNSTKSVPKCVIDKYMSKK
ncbi:MAG: hypothetical protein Satyrvirus1_22 [Satyrvirus sp.]|uniref:Uncharacterized protein n=1 Tax=Satyrvirus sp. TaxID=2487771 RepID=A0A3G5ACJ5_9VIRU|nr:MAG: hypothetical protein Satyrvirus1_22 [Satyrvirus sp.]